MTIQLKVGRVAGNPWERARLFVNNKEVLWQGAVVLLRGQENDVRVEASPELARQLRLELVESGELKIEAFPKFSDWVDPDNGSFNWKIKSDDDLSGKITLLFLSKEEVAPWLLECLVMSDDLANELKVLVNGDVIPPGGRNFNGNQAYRITVSWKDPEFAQARVKLGVVPVSGVGAGDFTSMPDLDQPTPTRTWDFKGGMKPGTFKLRLSTENGMAKMETPINRLLTYADFALRFDTFGQPAPLPPEKVTVLVGFIFAVAVRLRNSAGTPLAEIPVECFQDGNPLGTGRTNSTGYLQIGLALFREPQLLKYSAIATLPDHTTSETDVLIDVVAAEQETDAT